MKYTTLSISILLTLLVFSMSCISGSDSGLLSYGITNDIYNILNVVFKNNNIDIDVLHHIVRKFAHGFEYMILAISWFFTVREWNGSLAKVLGIGILIAGIDETIQIFAIDRGPSIVDALLFDFLSFALTSYLIWLKFNKRKEVKMGISVLTELKNNEISSKEAYKKLFKNKNKKQMQVFSRAHFIKFKIIIPEKKGVSKLLSLIFLIPFPIIFLKIILSLVKMDKYNDDIPLDKREIMDLISHKGIKINVKSHSGEKVLIKTI